MLHGVVRGTATAAPAALSAFVRRRLPDAVRSEVRGALRRSARTSEAGYAPGGREPVDGEAGQGERGEHGDERGAERRREEDTAVTGTKPSNLGRSVPARQRR